MAKKIKVNIFRELKEALEDLIAYERGEPIDLRVTRFPERPKKSQRRTKQKGEKQI
jgi:hypothetical protein